MLTRPASAGRAGIPTSSVDLLAALTGAGEARRLAALAQVRDHPVEAQALATAGGWDLVGLLVQQAEEPLHHAVWSEVLRSLVVFDDARVVAVCTRLLPGAHRPWVLELLAERLAEAPLEPLCAGLTELLTQNRQPEHARAVAPLLRGADLARPAAFRRDLLLGQDSYVATDLEVALAELHGPFAAEAQALLEDHGEAVFLAVRARWPELSLAVRAWLLGWGSRAWPARTVDLLADCLSDATMCGAARACLAQYQGAEWLFDPYRCQE